MRLRGKTPEVIPAGQRVIFHGYAHVHNISTGKVAVIELSSEFPLPGGVLISCCVPNNQPYKVPVMLENEMDHDVLIPVNSVIAELNLVQCSTYEETDCVE